MNQDNLRFTLKFDYIDQVDSVVSYISIQQAEDLSERFP